MFYCFLLSLAKGRQSSKGFSSQAHTLPRKTTRLKHNEKTKSIPKSQQKDANDARLTKNQNTGNGQASEDAGYVTKDQLSRILLSLTSADVQALQSHSPPGHGQDSQSMYLYFILLIGKLYFLE